MEFHELEELRKRKRGQVALLTEVGDLTKQMLDALNRRDEVSLGMLLDMREAPVRRLREMDEGLRQFVLSLPESSAIRAAELLRGAEANSTAEEPLCEDVGRYSRLLSSVIDLDKRLSLSMGGGKSFYKTFRE